MTRTNNTNTLSNVSPFLLKKAIDITCSGEVEECKKIRSGSVLIKTKNHAQANRLITLTTLSNEITIQITEHKTLNYSKDVIYCNALRGIPQDEILEELKSQNVCLVEKILKKDNNNLIETGLVVLTFDSTTLPEDIRIGYEKINIRPHIPRPLRCNNCFYYGNISKFCKNNNTCPFCAKDYHLNTESKEECRNKKLCVNCHISKVTPNDHSAIDKKCPIFIKQQELQAIKTTLKVDNKTAFTIYQERHQHNHATYLSVVTTQPPIIENTHSQPTTVLPPSSQRPAEHHPPINTTNQHGRPVATYSDVVIESDSEPNSTSSAHDLASKVISNTKLKIFPRNTSKRLISQLKSKNKLISKSNVKQPGKTTTNHESEEAMEDF
ncbi:uncharacterized protein LOC128869865 [Anastrepha ludens]|uniref:uncharacterized protein LOC128869865 n=1 Tax=Anastrepha ludens TaxID=28586 RepID=UPI0023AF0515|nr:uncharacterized protein LOC128869865 [Anastrepha ludens]